MHKRDAALFTAAAEEAAIGADQVRAILLIRVFFRSLSPIHICLPPLFSRNTVCVCAAVCPSATSEWLECFKGVVKKQRQGASGVELNACDDLKRRLEICTQHASSKLLHAAVMPSDRNDVVL